MRGLLSFILMWAWIIPPLAARERLLFSTLSLEQGLSQSIVECMLQDRRGFLWLGTEDGLNRYDGYTFTIFKENSTDPNSLSHDNILCLLQDDEGFIWIGTYHGGLNRYGPETGKFTRFVADPDDPASISHNIVAALAQDGEGTIWVGTARGLEAWKPGTDDFVHAGDRGEEWSQLAGFSIGSLLVDSGGSLWIGTYGRGVFLIESPGSPPRQLTPGVLANASIASLAEDSSGRIWIGSLNLGAFRWDRETGRLRAFPPNPDGESTLRSPTVRSILCDRGGTIWLGSDNGLHRYEGEGRGFSVYNAATGDPRSISHNEIHCVFEDRAEVLWLGTYGGGVSKSMGRNNHFLHYRSAPDDPNSLSNDIVWSFYEDSREILWIGTHGGGLERLDRKTQRFTRFRNRPGDPTSLSDNRVRVVTRTRDGMFWVGTNGGGINRFNPRTRVFTTYRNDPDVATSLSFDIVRCILEDSLGNLWIGTLGGGLNRMDRKTGAFTRYLAGTPGSESTISNNVVRVLYESPAGVLWIGTYGGGIDKLDIRSGVFSHIAAEPENPEGLSNNYIFSIHEDREGIFWLGTEGGLNRMDPETGKCRRYGVKEGLPDNTIYGILEDNYGFLWVSTSNGLGRFDPRTGNCRNFHDVDGLQNNEFNGGAFYRNKKGELFFGGINGFNIIDPSRIKQNQYLPPIVITDFRKFNQAVAMGKPLYTLKEVELSHRDDMVSFGFAALDFTVPEKNRYSYRMEGLSDKWIDTGADHRYATFTSLPAGKYVLQVKGANNHGVWNHAGTTLVVRVKPPWWRTWWFQITMLFSILATVFISYRLRIRDVKHETRMRAELRAAHEAQASIMPGRSPRIAGYDIAGISVPASEVGGDFFDYLWTGDGESRFAVVLGDVSGKGMKAAMTAVMADGILCACSAGTRDIQSIMTRLNQSLCRKIDRRDFVAMVIADFNKDGMAFINSGLPDPILKRGDRIMSLVPEGRRLPPGVHPERSFTTSRVDLLPGDILVFMSDGVTEAMDASHRLYGLEGFMESLDGLEEKKMTAGEILETLVADVNAFMDDFEARDDITMVVVKKEK